MKNGLMNRLAIFALPLILSSCLVGPDYVKPPTATPPTPEYKETSDINFRPATPRDSIDRGPWWNIYGDGALEQLVAQVDVSNQNLKAQEAAYRQAVAQWCAVIRDERRFALVQRPFHRHADVIRLFF